MELMIFEPIDLMDDFLKLKLFCTAVSMYHQIMKVVLDQDMSRLIVAARKKARKFCVSPFHAALFHTALGNAKEKGIIRCVDQPTPTMSRIFAGGGWV